MPEQFALEEYLPQQSRRLAVGARVADAVDGAGEGQRLERPIASGQVLADEDVAAEERADDRGVGQGPAGGYVVQIRPDDWRGPAEGGEVGVVIEEFAAVAPQVAFLHVPAALAPMLRHEARQAPAHQVI